MAGFDPPAKSPFAEVVHGLIGVSEKFVTKIQRLLGVRPEDPAVAELQVQCVCKCYYQALELHEQGTHRVSLDEMTGIQTPHRKHATQVMQPGQVARREFECPSWTPNPDGQPGGGHRSDH